MTSFAQDILEYGKVLEPVNLLGCRDAKLLTEGSPSGISHFLSLKIKRFYVFYDFKATKF